MRTIILLATILLAGCGGGGNKTITQTTKKVFIAPDAPAVITDPMQRLEFKVLHFWDNFDFKDTITLRNADITEQAFATFIYLANQAEPETGVKSIENLLAGASDSVSYNYFTELCDKYLYDPNAPTKNETLYITVLRNILNSPFVSDLEKIRPQDRLNIAVKNRPGESATDFTYTLANEKSGRLYDIKSKYILLFFNNMGCAACTEIKQGLSESEIVNRMIDHGNLKVLTVYPDEDVKVWRDFVDELPKKWINGYDKHQTISNERLYDLKAIPTLYLMDSHKRVILKDCFSVDQIEAALVK